MTDVLPVLGLVVTALLAALAGLFFLTALQGRRPQAPALFDDRASSTEFLFDGDALVDATPAARALLRHSPQLDGSPWPRLLAWLVPRFPDLTARLTGLPTEGRIVLASAESAGPALLLTLELRGGLTRLTLTDAAETTSLATDPLTHRATEEELARLRIVTALAPLPIWQEDEAGAILWANTAYHRLIAVDGAEGSGFQWPTPRLFDRTAAAQGARTQRQRIDAAGGGVRWFELAMVTEAPGRFVYALPADPVVQAETALQEFMQTLTKTFAQLNTGLAIFDRDRRLQLFNPALMDLTGLQPDFLSARPRLTALLDALRERSMIPEPRDWHSWRAHLDNLEKAAAAGLHEETWPLPGGQTYRVTARPHPNGALALMLEDISSEMSQTRRYRADLELGQAVIDAMDEAIAVFSSAGVLVLSNTAYAALWNHDPGATLNGGSGIGAICGHWRDATAPSAVWDRAEDFVAQMGPREAWADLAYMTDGRPLWCRFAALSGGATLAGFRLLPASAAAAEDGADRQTA